MAAAFLAACGSGEDDNGSARDRGDGATASCGSIDELESYRYFISVKLQSPAFESTGQASPEPPLSAFAETLTALLSDFTIKGAHVAPDRTLAILQFQQDEVEIRAIGEKRWERMGSVWREQDDTAPDIGFLTPKTVCEEVVEEIAPSLGDAQGQPETVSGVKSDHYTLDKADVSQLPRLLGTTADAKLPHEFQVDVWLTQEERWPIRLKIAAEDRDEQGNPISVNLLMEFRDINDEGIRIEPPPVASPAG